MSIQPLIFKNGVYTLPRSAADIEALKVTLGISTSNFVDVSNNQTIDGAKLFSGSLRLPNNAGTIAGTIWRSGDNLEYKDGANITKILLNSAGNLSNLMNKQTALNNLVNGQIANRVLRSDGTNVTLSQVNLISDVTNILPIANGGTGSSTQNFVDISSNQTISGTKHFNGELQLPNNSGATNGTIWRSGDALNYRDGAGVVKVLLNSAGNLSNLADRQISLNNLVGTQTANRILRSNGTNVTLSQVALDTDVTNVLSLSNGGTGSNTQNFVDLTTVQNVGGTKTFASVNTLFGVGGEIISTQSSQIGFYSGYKWSGSALVAQASSAGFIGINFYQTGLALCFDSGLTVGSSTGNTAITKLLINNSNVQIPISVASTSTTTGALVVGGGIGADHIKVKNAWLHEVRSSVTGVLDGNALIFTNFAGTKWVDGGSTNLNLPSNVGMISQFDSLFGTAVESKYRVQEFLNVGTGTNGRFWKRTENNGTWGTWLEIGFLEKSNTWTGTQVISNATAATSTTTGAFRISAGGGSVVGNWYIGGSLVCTSNTVNFSALPTSSSGLSAGSLWRNGNVINIV